MPNTEYYFALVIRRILATFVFLIWTGVCSIVSIPAALVDRSGHLFCVVSRIWARFFHILFDITIEVHGVSHIKTDENYIFAANHSSYTDIPAVLVAIPKDMRLVMRNTLTRIPVWGWSMLASPYLIINRTNAVQAKRTLGKAVEKIREGANVLLFPEGTRTHTGKLQPFKRGAFHLAYEGGSKVVPVHIAGSFELLNRFDRIPHSHRRIIVHIGKPLSVDTTIEGDRNREMDLMRRTEEAVREMAAM